MSRQPPRGGGRRPRRDEPAPRIPLPRVTPRQLSRFERVRLQQRLLYGTVGAVGLLAATVVGFGVHREFFGFPGEPVAIVYGESVSLRTLTDTLADEMRRLQTQTGSGLREETNPQAASAGVQRLISAQETLPEEVLESEIEKALIRSEGRRRNIEVSRTDVDAKINEFLSIQRDLLNQPTNTPTSTPTPRPTRTATPEDFEPSPTPTPSPTFTPAPTDYPTVTPTPSSTPDPDATPTPTNTPRPTRTPAFTATLPATLQPEQFDKAYADLARALRSEQSYRYAIENQVLRKKLRDTIGASARTEGPLARVLRLATSTGDESRVALIALQGGFSTFEELVDQVSERPAEGKESGDLGWVALGAESREFDEVVFSLDTPLEDWSEPFAVGHHFEVVKILERSDFGPFDEKNVEKIRDRLFQEWLLGAKVSPDVLRDLSPVERQWAIDRASRGIFVTETPRR